jgi:hypothetical protein
VVREVLAALLQQVAWQRARLAQREWQVVWMRFLPLPPVVSAQTGRSVNSQKAASLPGRLP